MEQVERDLFREGGTGRGLSRYLAGSLKTILADPSNQGRKLSRVLASYHTLPWILLIVRLPSKALQLLFFFEALFNAGFRENSFRHVEILLTEKKSCMIWN
jgi:hypothetical protein